MTERLKRAPARSSQHKSVERIFLLNRKQNKERAMDLYQFQQTKHPSPYPWDAS